MTTDIIELAQSVKRRVCEGLYVKADDILKLVDALEKVQQVDEELCKLLPPGVEYMYPPDGGSVTPLNQISRMIADYRQRIFEMEGKLLFCPGAESK